MLTTGISTAGLIGSVGYLWLCHRRKSSPSRSPVAGRRPWRPVGAVMCGVVSVLFYVGVQHLDPSGRPGLFLILWAVIVLLLVCLCVMAVVDVLYTRRLVRRMLDRPMRAD